MENKTKYRTILLFGIQWILMREEEGPLPKRCVNYFYKFEPSMANYGGSSGK